VTDPRAQLQTTLGTAYTLERESCAGRPTAIFRQCAAAQSLMGWRASHG
jgi:hypothetical protein